MALPKLFVPAALKNNLKAGHPWVYRDQLTAPPQLPDGAWVRVRCGDFEAFGLWDEAGPIAVRIYSRAGVPDAAWVRSRVRQAWELRSSLRAGGETDAYRWIYGEGDGLPAVVVDLYGEYAVIHRYARGVEPLKVWLTAALHEEAPLKGIVERPAGGEALDVLWGKAPPRDLVVRENGLRFRANLFAGQKTGLFLDQRDNRRTVEAWSRGKTLLNCFAYTGGFSLYALRGGASAVTTCDSAPAAMADARANFVLNGYDPASHEFVTADVFDLLEECGRRGRRFDLIVLDPPSFAKSKQNRFAAQRAYVRLNQMALRCLEPDGILATASCTSQVSPEAFRQALAEAGAQAGRRLAIVHDAGHALDHPVPAGFPEGRYLKFIVAQASVWP
jgi:23S rRNA (cytosine1962-C5)-methyltransferase